LAKHNNLKIRTGSIVEGSENTQIGDDGVKRYGHLYEKVYDLDNLKIAHKNARKGKGWYEEVCMVDRNPEKYLGQLQQALKDQTYNTSEYVIFDKQEGNKVRQIYKLPYFPDRICQWALLQVIEPILTKQLTADTYSALPGKGIHLALHKLQTAIYKDPTGTKYCLKLDLKKYYPNIDHAILKQVFRRIFKDEKLLWLIDEIIDSTPGDKGIPIGNYMSQWSGNLYLSAFDHWIKEVKGIKYYFRYMDDIVILHESKEYLHKLKHEIEEYLMRTRSLAIKENWQVFPVAARGIDFLGYRIFPGFTLLRKSTLKRMKYKVRQVNKHLEVYPLLTHNQWCSLNSYRGWLVHCDSFRLQQKYIVPLEPAITKFYEEVIVNESQRNATRSKVS